MRNFLSRGLIVSALFALTGGIPAQADVFESDGTAYDLGCTKDGYVLKSKRGSDVLYLGRSCDAFSKTHGKGTWCWANGGFVAELPSYRYGFPRQELRCPAAADYQGSCGCQ